MNNSLSSSSYELNPNLLLLSNNRFIMFNCSPPEICIIFSIDEQLYILIFSNNIILLSLSEKYKIVPLLFAEMQS